MMFISKIKKPSHCADEELSTFESLVRGAGEVNPNGLNERIRNAHYLMFLFDEAGESCGVSALKMPADGYRSRVFNKAHSVLSPASYPLELGWVVVSPAHQGKGLSYRLVSELLSTAGGDLIYATTRVDNTRMHRTLVRAGFREEGGHYRSTRHDHDLTLFVQPPKTQ